MMKKNISALLRTMMLVAMVPVLSLSLVACDSENGAGGNGGEEGSTEDTTSEIAVTGLVDVFGCTYADISGYANLNLLPAGGGNPVIGVEVVEAETNENIVQSTASSLVGNVFTVSFSNLSPATEYKYRSFVTCGGITYYGNKYKTFTTKEAVGITSTGEASEIKVRSAVLSFSVQIEGLDERENPYVGLAWSTSRDAIRIDGNFESHKIFMENVAGGEFSVSLNDLPSSTTYYYASFTLVGDVYVFSSVKEFTTEEIPEGAVDLGLSVLWASCNVGAESPEEYGDYFAWGETRTKTSYTESNSVTFGRPSSLLESRGIISSDGNLTVSYDAATVNWGSDWRMPIKAEQDELRTECDWEWTTKNGVNGYEVTGPNGNSIFLPAAGYRSGTSLSSAGSYGYYWSATSGINSSEGYILRFGSSYYDWSNGDRRNGHPIRPVTE